MVLRSLIDVQVRLARAVDRRLPAIYREDGHEQYKEHIVPAFLRPGICVYDVGGGKRPYLTADAKRTLGARVVGIDIDRNELDRAPAGIYDRSIAADIATIQGDGDADLIICQAVFEHVHDVEGGTRALASILRPGGVALLFVPCRNALFARLNLLLPESVKRSLLFGFYPGVREHQGFPSYYQHCTPSALGRIAEAHGLEVLEIRPHWASGYFHAFLPAYAGWRAWTILARELDRRDFCETFTLILRKPPSAIAA